MNEYKDKFIVSSHIPKTAGRAFLISLIKIFGDENVLRDYGKLQPEGDMIRKIEPHHKCIHGHFTPRKYKDSLHDAIFVTWIRHPVDRVLSAYYFWERDKSKKEGHIEIMDFIEGVPDSHNLQSRMFDGFKLDDFAFIGITEYYESMHNKFCELIGVPIVEFVKFNYNPNKEIGESYKNIPHKVRKIIKRNNELDIELWNNVIEWNKKRGML